MSYKCSVCGMADVANAGDVCLLCSDPYAQPAPAPASHLVGNAVPVQTGFRGSSRKRNILLNGGESVYTGAIIPTANDSSVPVPASGSAQGNVQIYQNGQSGAVSQAAPTQTAVATPSKAASITPITAGITKNVNTDKIERGFLFKWFRSVFAGIPFTFDNDVTTFQVFPDYSGQSLNQSGYACDQVVVYGKVPMGFISENNDVEIFGHRDSQGNIIASTIKNTASGTTVKANWSFSAATVRILTLPMILLLIISPVVVLPVIAIAAIVLLASRHKW